MYQLVIFLFIMAARPGTAPGPWESKSHVLLLYERAIVGYSVVMTLSFHLFSIRFGLDLLNRATTGGLWENRTPLSAVTGPHPSR